MFHTPQTSWGELNPSGTCQHPQNLLFVRWISLPYKDQVGIMSGTVTLSNRDLGDCSKLECESLKGLSTNVWGFTEMLRTPLCLSVATVTVTTISLSIFCNKHIYWVQLNKFQYMFALWNQVSWVTVLPHLLTHSQAAIHLAFCHYRFVCIS